MSGKVEKKQIWEALKTVIDLTNLELFNGACL